MDPAAAGRAAERAAARRRQHRPGDARPADDGGGRPPDRRPARHQSRPDRHHARQRVRAVGGLHDLHRAQPVSRGDGSRSALRPESRVPQGYLRPQPRRHADPAFHGRALRVHQHPPVGEPPGPVRRLDDLVQPARGGLALDRDRGDQRHHGAHRRAGVDLRRLPGHRARLPGDARAPAVADPRGDRRDVPRARHALREHDPPDHHPVDAALRRRRRAARAARVQDRVRRHRADRGVPADRDREEERDHDGRLRARRGAPRGPHARARRSSTRREPALPPDPDDDGGGDARARCRSRSAPATAPSCASRSASPSSAA